MTKIWFIRHGESESNAGLPTLKASSSGLTMHGREQAIYLSQYIPSVPDLIAVSSYTRSQQTAEPIRDRFPSLPQKVWPVHEFTYLSSIHYLNSTVSDRRSAANQYWLKSDPDYIDGDQAESFNQMITRVEKTNQLMNSDHHKFIIVISHGWFIRALLWHQLLLDSQNGNSHTLNTIRSEKQISLLPYVYLHLSKSFKYNKRKMWHYLFFSASIKLPNISIVEFGMYNEQPARFTKLIKEHIPSHLIRSSFLDR